jgi:hypothetical protein
MTLAHDRQRPLPQRRCTSVRVERGTPEVLEFYPLYNAASERHMPSCITGQATPRTVMPGKKLSANASMQRISQVSHALRRDLRTTLYINITNIINLFRSWDTNEDGMVHPVEFRKALDEIGIELLDEAEFKVLWNLIDMDKNGSLSVRELQVAIARCARTVLCPDRAPPMLERCNELKKAYGDGLTVTEEETLRCSMVKKTWLPQLGPINHRVWLVALGGSGLPGA